MKPFSFFFMVMFLQWGMELLSAEDTPWSMHVIDNTSRGADGVDLADINGDGWLDLCSPWEEGGEIRVYLNPGPDNATRQWEHVTVGKVRSPEDAKFVDLDGDGRKDVVSCCEGKERTVYVHWAPAPGEDLLKGEWKTTSIPVTQKLHLWMFSLPLQIDGRFGPDLIVGSKGEHAEIGWLEAPEHPRDVSSWKWHPIYDAGWIMSLISIDMDQDGDLDIVTSDRKGDNRGCLWLENPGRDHLADKWRAHIIGGDRKEVMFMTSCDLDRDQQRDFLVAVSGGPLLWLFPSTVPGGRGTQIIPLPENIGTGKGVASGDLNLDGIPDIVFSCENAKDKHGVMWLEGPFASGKLFQGKSHPISGTAKGIKYDLIELLDLDADGDLDVLTCEERDNLGIIWYENPAR